MYDAIDILILSLTCAFYPWAIFIVVNRARIGAKF